jgi:MoaA/NifB/PqqE/SkfB family radical SAM enzyme
VHLGTRCNSRCIFCMSSVNRDAKEPWASLGRVKEELRHFYAKGCRAAGFLGGEPTAYPHIVDCVAYAKSLGYVKIVICTNGMRLADAAFCRDLVGAGLTRVTVSVHSHKPEVEDRLITRVPDALERKARAVRNLVRLRDQGLLPGNISLNPVLCRPNLCDMEAYIRFFGGLGVDDIRFNYIWPHGEVKADPAWTPAYREAMPEVVRILLANEKRLRKHLSFGGIPKCALLLGGVSGRLMEYLASKYLDEAGFDPANDVSMATKQGPMRDRFVWQQVKKDVLKTMGPDCGRCRHQSRCEGVWASYAELYGFGELRPL